MKRFMVLIIAVAMGIFAVSAGGPITCPQAIAQKSDAPVTMESCQTQCRNCQKICEKTLAYCQKKGGKHAEAKHINTLKDCITACKTSADFLNRKSERHAKSCAFCAEICRACAVSCETFKGDKQMQDCAAECRRCAESCDKMAAQMK
jgi:hypothetical protein